MLESKLIEMIQTKTGLASVYYDKAPVNEGLPCIILSRSTSMYDADNPHITFTRYQVSCFALDIDVARLLASNVIELFAAYQGFVDGKPVQISVDSDSGDLFDGESYHVPVIILCKSFSI